MGNEVARHSGSTLVVSEEQNYWNDNQLAALRQLGVRNAQPADLAVFFHQCQRTGLDPFAKQIYLVSRLTKNGVVQTIQTGIDGFRLIARRAVDHRHETLEYEDTLWCDSDGRWTDVWLKGGYPAAAKSVLKRGGSRFTAVVLWAEFVQTTKDGAPNQFWRGMPSNQLAKVAEAHALRKAFPQDLSGIFSDDEMPQVEAPEVIDGDTVEPVEETVTMRRNSTPQAPSVVHEGQPEPAEPVDTQDEGGGWEKPSETPEPAKDDGSPATSSQQHRMGVLLGRAGLTSPADKLQELSNITTRDITNPAQVTRSEATQIIYDLEATQ